MTLSDAEHDAESDAGVHRVVVLFDVVEPEAVLGQTTTHSRVAGRIELTEGAVQPFDGWIDLMGRLEEISDGSGLRTRSGS